MEDNEVQQDPYGIKELYGELRAGPQESHQGDAIQEARNRQSRIEMKAHILSKRGLSDEDLRNFKVEAYANAIIGDPASGRIIEEEYLRDNEELSRLVKEKMDEIKD